jgi:hypothetical protein
MPDRRSRSALLVAALVGFTVSASHGAASLPSPSEPPTERATPAGLTGGAASLEELLDRFITQLRARSREGLEALRVSEDEYRSILVPGSVDPGQPPQVMNEDGLAYFWTEMSQKSAAHRDAILRRFGGRPLARVRYGFEKGVREFAGYRAYEKLVVVLRDEQGGEIEIHTGSIVERDGRFKFASFIRD